MSDTPNNADACVKLLDNGWVVRLFRNWLGSYTAVTSSPSSPSSLNPDGETVHKTFETDDFTPAQALYRLTEKVFGNIC